MLDQVRSLLRLSFFRGRPSRRPSPPRIRPRVEGLEDRAVPSVSGLGAAPASLLVARHAVVAHHEHHHHHVHHAHHAHHGHHAPVITPELNALSLALAEQAAMAPPAAAPSSAAPAPAAATTPAGPAAGQFSPPVAPVRPGTEEIVRPGGGTVTRPTGTTTTTSPADGGQSTPTSSSPSTSPPLR